MAQGTVLGLTGSFLLGLAAVLALMMNVVFFESFHSARLTPVLAALILVHLMLCPRFAFGREAAIYLAFFVFMLVALLWTDDLKLAMNTLVPALNFIVILILFDSLLTYHDNKAVLLGMFTGTLVGALANTASVGFPFVYPPDFSYNAVALMYLFGLFIALLLGYYSNSKVMLRLAALVFFAHIVATTSIKTNLGIIFGLAVASVLYLRDLSNLVRRNIVPLVVLLAALGYLVVSNDSLMRSMERGVGRVTLGIDVLQAREDLPGYRGFESRGDWQKQGLAGWAQNPVFGNGVESFRARIGTTSHSSPVDLLHNSGMIGLVLFYALFVSLAVRLASKAYVGPTNVRFLIMSGLACFFFVSLSAPMHYSSFLAAFLALSIAILRRMNTYDPRVMVPTSAP